MAPARTRANVNALTAMIKSITSLSGEVAKDTSVAERENENGRERDTEKTTSSKKTLQWQSRIRCDGYYERA